MEEKLRRHDATPNLESLHEVRLTAMMLDLVKSEGKMEAARLLGVNHKTLTAAADSGKVTPRLSDALEKVLLSRRLEALDQVRERVEELAGRLEALEEWAGSVVGEAAEVIVREAEDTGRRLPETPVAAASEVVSSQAEGTPDDLVDERRRERGSTAGRLLRTTGPSVVTMERQTGDEEVFGAAWPLVDEWRRLRQSHPTEGRSVSWLAAEERLRELEITLVEERQLTLPPDTDPWDSLGRREQVRWRVQTLERVRRERVMAQVRRWVRRVLTMGLWRK